MKTRISIAILLISFTVLAGTVCFDIPAGGPTQRVSNAFGDMLGLKDVNGNPRGATQQEVTNATQSWVQQTTQDYERRQNMSAYSPSPVPITATPVPSSPTPTAIAAIKTTPAKKKKP